MIVIKFSLKQARNYCGLSQEEMAKKLGVTLKTYYLYENYQSEMRYSTAVKFSEITGVDQDNIFFLKNNNT